MYKILGADQREYGPVEADVVRTWIAQHRADGLTMAWSEDAAGWKRLAEFPEFADALSGGAPPVLGVAAPREEAKANGVPLADEVLARDYQLFIGDCLGRSWALLMERFWLLVGATAVMLAVCVGLGSVPAVGSAAALLLPFVLWGGVEFVFLKAFRGEPVDIGVAFSGFGKVFPALMLAGLVTWALTGVGLLLCVLPGIYLAVCWKLFTPLLILDRGLDFWQAMECSRRVVTRHWWTCLALALVFLLLVGAGVLVCGVGVLFTLPLGLGMLVAAYEEIFRKTASPAAGAATLSTALEPVPSPAAGAPDTPDTPPAPAAAEAPEASKAPTPAAVPTTGTPSTPPEPSEPPATPTPAGEPGTSATASEETEKQQ